MGDFAFSWKRGVMRVENVASLMLLVRLEDYAGSWRHGESGKARVLEPEETVISAVAFYDEKVGTSQGRQEVRSF